MTLLMKTIATLTALGTLCATPAVADPGRGNGHHRHVQAGHGHGHCPPGLAKKNPPCVPPGQVRQHYGNRTGETLRIGDYVLIRDPARFGLPQRRGWNYYRDDNRIYRVDSGTRKILAVLNLIDAFSR